MNRLLAAALLGLASRAGAAAVGPTQTTVFRNPDCAAAGTCDLKEFRVEVTPSLDASHGYVISGRQMVASHETAVVSELKEFGVVQFIRGCVFESAVKNGVVSKRRATVREFFGMKDYVFHHPAWVVDKIDRDPLYNENELGRFASSLNVKPDAFVHQDFTHFDYYYYADPRTPRLYISDSPVESSVDESKAGVEELAPTNASLEFQTCVFRAADVPTRATPDWGGRSKALNCVHWTESYVFDFDRRRFVETDEIDPFCLEPRTGDELEQDRRLQDPAAP